MLTTCTAWLRRSLALDAAILALEAPGLSLARRDALRRIKASLEPRPPVLRRPSR